LNQLNYAKGSPERAELTKAIQRLKLQFPVTIPIKINGSEVCFENDGYQNRPHKAELGWIDRDETIPLSTKPFEPP
jgi:hypothetical protein